MSPKHTMKKTNTNPTKCLTCDKETMCRGLCRSCYALFRHSVTRGDISERDAMNLGLVLEAKHAGAPGAWKVAMMEARANGKGKHK